MENFRIERTIPPGSMRDGEHVELANLNFRTRPSTILPMARWDLEECEDAINFSDLHEWLQANAIGVNDVFRSTARRKVFKDSEGITRFADTWQVADLDDLEAQQHLIGSNQSFPQVTGCLELAITVEFIHAAHPTQGAPLNNNLNVALDSSLPVAGDSATSRLFHDHHLSQESFAVGDGDRLTIARPVRLLVDFQHLWRYLEEDEDDELAIHAPLLSSYVKFVFHPKTVKLMHFLMAYNTMMFIVSDSCLDTSIYEAAFNALNFPAAWILYMSVLYLFCANTRGARQSSVARGPARERERFHLDRHMSAASNHLDRCDVPATAGAADSLSPSSRYAGSYQAELEGERNVIAMKRHELHWSASLKQLQSKFGDELKIFGRWCTSSKKSRSLDLSQQHHLHRDRRSRHTWKNNLRRGKLGRAFGFNKRIPFYELMNTSLKFLTRHTGVAVEEINFNRTSYRRMLVMTFFPIMFYYLFLIIPDIMLVGYTCAEDFSNKYCKVNLIMLLLSIGYGTFVVQLVVSFTAAMVAMTGLAYGAEIAFRLSDSWFRRFSSLRRVSSQRQQSKFRFSLQSSSPNVSARPAATFNNTQGATSSNITTSAVAATAISTAPSRTDTIGAATGISTGNTSHMESRSSGRSVAEPVPPLCAVGDTVRNPVSAGAQKADDNDNDMDDDTDECGRRLNAVARAGCDETITDSSLWRGVLPRPSALTQRSMARCASPTTSMPSGSTKHEQIFPSSCAPAHNTGSSRSAADALIAPGNAATSELPLDAAELMTYITRDSYEHYLFLREYMEHSSSTWSPLLLGIFTGAGYYIAGLVYGSATAVGSFFSFYYLFWAILVFSVLYVYPVLSLAHANSFSSLKLLDHFRHAAPEDYSVIGGNELWKAFLVESPAVLTFFGLWVTWERINALFWSLFVSSMGLILTVTTAKFGFSGSFS